MILGIIVVVVIHPYILNYRFATEAQNSMAEVTQCSVVEMKKADDYTRIEYRYEAHDMTYVGSAEFSGISCDPYALGTFLPATFLTSDPALSRIFNARDDSTPGPLTYFFLFLALISILFWSLPSVLRVLDYWLAIQMHPRLQAQGQLLQGKITALSHPGTAKDPRSHIVVVIDYEFEAPNNKMHTGRHTVYRKDSANKQVRSVGTPIVVLYADKGDYMML